MRDVTSSGGGCIDENLVQSVTEELYSAALRKVPDDTKAALASAIEDESEEAAKGALKLMLKSARLAEEKDAFVCSDSGVPVYLLEIGGRARWEGDINAAIRRGFDHLVATIQPPLLQHVANPLTNERKYGGKGMPLVSVELKGDGEHIDITCVPKALGSGRWTAVKTFISPTLQEMEAFVLDFMIESGQQICPPVVVGVGIGGSFDVAARLATKATYRDIGSVNEEGALADMERRLKRAINQIGYGPMGTGGKTTAMGVHVDYSYGHGYTPVAVCVNCWINRRTKARLHNDGRVERLM
ncbi:MAG: fumarate hydratase [Parvularculaceae bacterium]|nr:fumarate hydratase [Parvularculaceae bacterium]